VRNQFCSSKCVFQSFTESGIILQSYPLVTKKIVTFSAQLTAATSSCNQRWQQSTIRFPISERQQKVRTSVLPGVVLFPFRLTNKNTPVVPPLTNIALSENHVKDINISELCRELDRLFEIRACGTGRCSEFWGRHSSDSSFFAFGL
jgi:hypothetical protein